MFCLLLYPVDGVSWYNFKRTGTGTDFDDDGCDVVGVLVVLVEDC